MFLRALRRKPLPSFTRRSPIHRSIQLRVQSNKADTAPRIDRVLNRVPRFLRPYTESLRNAPVSNVAAFLVLHEITAIVPLVGLTGWFHWSGWVPSFLDEGSYVSEGVSKFGRYFARKGWFGFTKEAFENVDGQEAALNTGKEGASAEMEKVQRQWHAGETGSRILIEVATAYAITKVLLPVRIIFSVWATPWTARVFISRAFGRTKSAVAGTSATVGKDAVKGTKRP